MCVSTKKEGEGFKVHSSGSALAGWLLSSKKCRDFRGVLTKNFMLLLGHATRLQSAAGATAQAESLLTW